MNLQSIESFLMVYKYRNITMAAQKLYTSQSTVSHHIQMLEEELETPLFIRQRGHRTVEPTSGGEEFVPIAQQWMSLFQDTQRLKDHAAYRRLCIGSTELINNYTFVPLYQKHMEEIPEIHLRIRTHHSNELHGLLESRGIDIGFVFNRFSYGDIVSTPIYQEQMLLICHKDSMYRDGMDINRLSAKQEVYARWSDDFERWHDTYWRRKDCPINVGTGSQAIPFLNIPNRWTIAPVSVYQATKSQADIVCHALDSPPPALTCYQITHKYPKPSSKQLIEAFQTEVQAFIRDNDALNPIGSTKR